MGGQNLDSKKPHDTSLTTKFTTNREQNTLLNRFKDIFRDKNIAHLAFLIGFFRISGFVHLHRLIQEYERFGSIRILVGLDVDCLLYTLQAQGLDKAYQDERFRELFVRTQRQFIQKEREYSQEIEDSIRTLTNALESKKIQIRIVREKNVHAKFYIFHSEGRESHTHTGGTRYSGSLIVGSSNLSDNGLERNYEFNLESNQSDDIFYALQEFEYLWADSVPLSPEDIQSATKHTYLELRSPKELYYKLLLCHFGESFLTIDSSIKDLFRDYKPYDYQIHAIQEGLEKLKRYNGFFLSDVVGLGKTLIASIIAKKLQIDSAIEGKILIVCPPALQSSWEKHFDDLDISRYRVIKHDSLHQIQDTREYEFIIVDESHRFRTSTSDRYERLSNITQGKKVILLSATPQNNSPQDIANQVYLFCPRHQSHIEGISDLERFFGKIQKEFDSIKKERKELETQKLCEPTYERKRQELEHRLKNNSQTMRNELLEHIMIRRTRADIQELYQTDMKAQGLTFPEIATPQELIYDLDSHTHDLATQTILLLANDENNKSTLGEFGYARYLLYPNLTPEGQKLYLEGYGAQDERSEFYEDTAKRLSVLIQKILFKRFDSSITAFKATLNSQIRSLSALIASFEHNDIIIPKNYSNREKLYEAIEATESGDDDALERFLEDKEDRFIRLESRHFKPNFLERLKDDRATLEHLLERWERIEGDPKIEKLLEFLESKRGHKIVLFTEAATTARYIDSQLKARGYMRHICVDSSNRDALEAEIEANFDANYPQDRQKDDYQLIISTDTLAEGVNLHRADIIINYDTPYNSTKLMQRIGRINRIGTGFDTIHIYNFKPTYLANTIINIINISLQKLQSFHYTLGEDSAVYDESEDVQSQKLFSQAKEQDSEQSPDTKYKRELKELYMRDKKFFERIKAMPLKSRTIIAGAHTQSYAYIRQSDTRHSDSDTHSPYHITPSHTLLSEPAVEECEFYKIAEFLREHLETKPTKVDSSALATHYAHINAALAQHTESMKATKSEPLSELSAKETNALAKIQHLPQEYIDEEQKALLIDSIKRGNPKLAERIKKARFASARDIGILIEEFGLRASTKPVPREPTSPLSPPQIQLSITTIATHPTQKEHK